MQILYDFLLVSASNQCLGDTLGHNCDPCWLSKHSKSAGSKFWDLSAALIYLAEAYISCYALACWLVSMLNVC